MGEVYRARDSALRREVAIKVLPSFVSRDPDRLHRFEQEAQAAAALNHPNILAVYQFGAFEGAPYLVSELLEGATLRQLMQRGPIPVRKAIDYGVQIAHGLAAAHEEGIVHRDLKPENLFVTKDGRIKILDFGLAKLMQRQQDPGGDAPTQTKGTDPGMVMGTAGYMSPEQVRGKMVDHRTDIFAFGAILYEMLAGKRAFQRSTSAETMTAILNDDPPSISQIVQATPPGLQRVVHRCLEKSPEQRFHSASDLAFALEALSDSGSAPAGRAFPRSRSRWLWGVMAGLWSPSVALLIAWWHIPTFGSSGGIRDAAHRRWRNKRNLVYVTDRGFISTNCRVGTGKSRRSPSLADRQHRSEQSLQIAYMTGVTHDGSALLVAARGGHNDPAYPLWSMPLPAGEPSRLGNFETQNVDIFPDGRIVFAKFSGNRSERNQTADRTGSLPTRTAQIPRKLVSLPGYSGTVSVSPDGQQIVLSQGKGAIADCSK